MTHHWGYVYAVGSAILFGVSATFNKIILEDVHPTVVAGLIYLFAGITLFTIRFSPINARLVRMLRTPTETDPKFCRRDPIFLILVIVFGSIVAPFFFLNGLNQTTAVNASLLQNAESLFTVLIASIFFKEHVTQKELTAIIMILLGAVTLATNAQFSSISLDQDILGNLFILVACLFWGLDNNFSKLLCFKEDVILVTALKCFIGGSSLLSLSFLLNLSFSVPISAFPYIISVGAFSIGFSILFFMLSLREIGSIRTGTIFSTGSLFGALFAFIILQETFTLVQLLAGLAMTVGVYLLYRK